jgi:hypothetical protein
MDLKETFPATAEGFFIYPFRHPAPASVCGAKATQSMEERRGRGEASE